MSRLHGLLLLGVLAVNFGGAVEIIIPQPLPTGDRAQQKRAVGKKGCAVGCDALMIVCTHERHNHIEFYLLLTPCCRSTCRAGFFGVCFDGYALQTDGTCKECPKGTWTQDGIRCIPCPAGQYAESTASRICRPCAHGRTAPAGSAACTPCNPGEHQPVLGGTVCQICPPGQCASHRHACTPMPGDQELVLL